MFDLSHLSDKVGKGNKLYVGITPGNYNLQFFRFLFQKGYNLILVEKTEIKGIGEPSRITMQYLPLLIFSLARSQSFSQPGAILHGF
jgi:hypothetical protein